MMTRLLAISLLIFSAPAMAVCPKPDRQAVTDTVQAMFDASAADDAGKLEEILAPGFYAFDVGKRYDADSLEDAIRKMHQSGRQIAWHVTAPDVHISCDTAWIAYLNKGTLTESGNETPLVWLESANLIYVNKSWRISFLESARVSDAK